LIVGTIKYKNKFIYNIKAFDTTSTFSFVISSNAERAIEEMCQEGFRQEDGYDALWVRGGEISMSKIVVQTGAYTTSSGKSAKLPCNADLFCRLGALIMYVKTQCRGSNEVGYTGLSLASGEFEAKSQCDYVIPRPDTGEVIARVTLSYGSIEKLELDSGDFEISLSPSGSEEIFKRPKNGWSSGFRFTEDYLGFKVQTNIDLRDVPLSGVWETLDEVIAAHPEKDFVWLRGKKYVIVKDENLQEICDYLLTGSTVYYDTETTGLNITYLSRSGRADQCVGIILSIKFGESYFFPLQMKRIKNLCNGDHFFVMEHYLRPILEGKPLVCHNASFDWKVGYIYDINCNIVGDTMAMVKLTFGSEKKNYPIGLKENAKLLLGRDSLELSDLVVSDSWGEDDIKFWDLSEELVRLYACCDTDNTMGIDMYYKQNDLLARYNAQKVYEIEVIFSLAVGYQEFYGHHIDVDNLDVMRKHIGEDMSKLMAEMEKIVGHKFNPNSSQQLKQVMYQELGIPEQIDRATGRVTTNKEALQRLANMENPDGEGYRYPFCRLLKEYRENEGVRKIVDKFPETMTSDGFLFPSVYQYGAETGRVSIHDPNYQSYNNPVKKHVVPRKGYYMTDTDYSSIEYRVLASMVGNKRIMESFKDPDFDYHRYQAAHINRVPYASVTKKMRKEAKGINFGLPYGMGDESLGARVFGEATPENTRKAAALRSAYFKGQEDIRDWFEFHRDRGVHEGFTETFFGRRRYYRRSDFTEREIRRQAGNQVIQGCVVSSARLYTKEYGIIRIGDFVGETPTIWDGWAWTKGTIVYSGKKQLCRVHFTNGQVFECSPTHKFMVVSHRGYERFVECQNLVGSRGKANRSGHRVRVCLNYEPTDYEYTSQQFRSRYGSSGNVFIDDLNCSSYEKGVVLGRLGSDGNYEYRSDVDNSHVRFVVAEHEWNIIPDMENYMEAWSPSTTKSELREDRNQRLATIYVGCLALVKELQSLDIRHSISDKIFMDTDMLRGLISGWFDGDGGISGKTITLVAGTQYDFEELFRDLQKALLFFGIRSRYHKYDDRYVLNIKTNDNQRFLDEIGFLNDDKQQAGRNLVCIEDEHTFGKCLMVDYVEMTDEYVDMYDVCNTERGYYVSDGIVVHNSAADCYKLAVGRVFRRICREGWLGKVLLSGFIHDELLCEVSVDIDPMIWLRTLREEFEIEVHNSDGTPWCPIYMGFGWGRSWYEAKSVEVPIQMQWELVEKYGSTGLPNWDGDYVSFCNKVPDMIHDFEVRDTTSQMLDPKNQGKEIKPALNAMLLDLVAEASKKYPSDEFHTLYDEDGNELTKFVPSKSTQSAITQFCALYGVDRTRINLLDIKEETESASLKTGVLDEDIDLEERDPDEVYRERMYTQIQTFGFAVDVKSSKFVIKYTTNPKLLAFIKQYCKSSGDFLLVFRNYDTMQDFPSKYFISSRDVHVLAAGISKVANM